MKYPIIVPNIFNHPFTYESNLTLKVGDYVMVPFGKSKITGVVWDEFEKNNNKNFKTKKVIKKLDVTPLKKNTINFLNGKNNEDLAPIIIFILPLEIPLQINSFFFFEIPECQTAGLKPKYSKNFFSYCLVRPISGNNINPLKPFSINGFNASK